MIEFLKATATTFLMITLLRLGLGLIADGANGTVNAYIRFKRWCRKVKVAIQTDHEL
ncbi:hypothetical protein [Lacticaseibacillus porcinae]|uniref:hypothetical protein n=1 Tax=Lacticaseibacillus porcinae TaxID=1123687 RepID=UPI0013DDAC35|nr:hypothetical protein [Lacticaseibacillus porcinae]